MGLSVDDVIILGSYSCPEHSLSHAPLEDQYFGSIIQHGCKVDYLDTDSLAQLSGISIKTFRKEKENHWYRIFKFSEATKKCFDWQIKTDGVGCSVVLKTETLRPIPAEKPESESDDPMAMACMDWKAQRELKDMMALQGKTIFIGMDPGRKDIVSCVRTDLPTGAEKATSLSTAQYYNDAKMNQRKKKMRHHLRKAGLTQRNREMPSLKVFTVAQFEEAVRYIFMPQLDQLIDLKCSRAVKKLRWRVYIHKYQTLDAFCKKLLSGIPDKS